MQSTYLHKNIKIHSLTHDGRGVARIEGKTIFVTDAVPGDTVDLRITKQLDKFDEAELLEINTPSRDRVEPFCELYQQCGGCQLQHLSIEAQRQWKTENFITRLTQAVNAKHCQISPALVGEDIAYRRRARLGLVISKKDKVARLGFRHKASNELIDIESCPILTKPLNLALQTQRAELLEQASRAYKEITFVEANNGVFSTIDNQDQPASVEPYYQVDDINIHFPADGFVQINQQQNQAMISQAIDWLELDKNKTVLDLFCGVGNFTLPIAKKAKSVTGIEGLSELVSVASHNAQSNQINNVQFAKANLFDDCQKSPWFRMKKYHRVLLDPGRQGAYEVSKVIHNLKPEIIVYVSCNAATLIRDIQALEKQGYQLNKAGLIDIFPHTNHTEVMVQLRKSKKPKPKKAKIFKL